MPAPLARRSAAARVGSCVLLLFPLAAGSSSQSPAFDSDDEDPRGTGAYPMANAIQDFQLSNVSSSTLSRTAHQRLVVEATGHSKARFRTRSRKAKKSVHALTPSSVSERVASEVCPTVERFGGDPKTGYGAWTLCTSALQSSANVTAFSVGIGSDASFDVDLVRRYPEASVFCLDPTISNATFEHAAERRNVTAAERSRLTFQRWGLGRNDDVLPFYHSLDSHVGSLTTNPHLAGYQTRPTLVAPILKLETLYNLAGAPDAGIDVLKMDIEGAEWLIFDSHNYELRSVLRRRPPGQIAIEFHDRFLPAVAGARASHQAGAAATAAAAARGSIVHMLNECGFVQRHASASNEEVLFVLDRARGPSQAC